MGQGFAGLRRRNRRNADEPGDEEGNRSFLDLLVERLPELVDWPEGCQAYLDRKSNVLVVRAPAATLEQVQEVLDEIDVDPPQILIETHYLEVEVDTGLDLGVEWSHDRRFDRPAVDANLQTDPAASGPLKGEPSLLSQGASFFGLPGAVGGGVSGSQFEVLGIFDESIIKALIYTLSTQKSTNQLAAPRVIATNNSRAQIAIVRNLSFIDRFEIVQGTVSQTQETAVTTPTSVRAVVNDSNFTGVLLNAKPSVGADGKTVHVVLQPVIREQVDEIQLDNGAIVVDGATEVSTPPLTRPILETRLTTTQLSIEDGAWIVLGGLMTARESTRSEGLPFLEDIPLLGYLFKREVREQVKRNLLIFVTARIVNPAGGRYVDGPRRRRGRRVR
ncbi:MAG: hypothetical protein D6731_21440 [Planctomycetota bacterium]|nr:MAG: hypothetical protein D6731_21440 [Planctomycetota bacterium]